MRRGGSQVFACSSRRPRRRVPPYHRIHAVRVPAGFHTPLFHHSHRRDERHLHSMWQDIQSKSIFSMKFLAQTLEYVHSNPVRKEWRLVADRAECAYSSACWYDAGRPPIIPVRDLRDWLVPTPPPRTAAGAIL